MKTITYLSLLSVLFLFIQRANAQTQSEYEAFNLETESIRLTNISKSPEAQAFEKYGDTPVNLYHGTPNIQVPIYTHKGRELNLPINLSYDASGVKVEQVASQTGLGWNLNVGGRISRIVNGLPDDYFNSTLRRYYSLWDTSDNEGINVNAKIAEYANSNYVPLFDQKSDLVDYMHFLHAMDRNKYDTQPDYFSFNALGYSDTFVIDVSNSEPVPLDNIRNLVDCHKSAGTGSNASIPKWTVTTEDGTQFIFDAQEVTHALRPNDVSSESLYGYRKDYVSSWLLTKIISPTGKDVYEFEYTDFTNTTDFKAGALQGATNNVSVLNPQSTLRVMNPNSDSSTIDQKMLSRIIHNNKRIVDVDVLNTRWDMNPVGIENINIYSKDTGNDTQDLNKSYKFDYGYFRTENAASPPYSNSNTPNPFNVQLKLQGIDVHDDSNTYVNSYYFNYFDSCKIATLYSTAQDYYGYFNGQNNTVLYPQETYGNESFPGANRDPRFSYAIRGTISKITYPTGGFTEFEFEPNSVLEPNGQTTQWQTRATSTINYPSTFPPVNNNACNAYDFSTNQYVTPETNIQSFEAQYTDALYKLTFTKTVNGGGLQVSQNDKQALLVKVPEATTVLNWEDIFDAACDPIPGVEIVWNLPEDVINSHTEIINLNQGYYRLVLSNTSSSISNSIEIEEALGIITYETVDKAGIRVKSIKNYTSENNLSTLKTYNYSGSTIISDPRYIYTGKSFSYDAASGTFNNATILHRMSYTSKTNKPHIGYSSVTETSTNTQNNDENINSTSKFYTQDGFYNDGVYTYYINGGKETANHYGVNYKLGKPSHVISNSDSEGVTNTVINTYADIDVSSFKGIYIQPNEKKKDLFPLPKQNPTTNKWYIDYVPYDPAIHGGNSGVGWLSYTEVSMPQPQDCFQDWGNDASKLCTPRMAALTRETTNAWQRVGVMTDKTVIDRHNSSEQIIVSNTKYSYYGINEKHLLQSSATTTSENKAITTEYLYPENLPSEYPGLINANMLYTPVSTKLTVNNRVSEKKTEYDAGLLPKRIKTAKGQDALETRLNFEIYANNNLVQARQENGTPMAYVWGYDNRYVIAKVDNATYQDIQNLPSFGSTIDNGLSATQETELRSLANAFVTTYAYEPNIGLTKITDTNNESVTYEYDDQGRLINTKNDEGELLNKYAYNYKPTSYTVDNCGIETPAALSASFVSVSVDNSSNLPNVMNSGSIVGLQGGTPPYNYNWTYSATGNTGYVPLGNSSTFLLHYNTTTDWSTFCGNYDPSDPNSSPPDITFQCVITDSAASPDTITLTKTIPATCYNNQN